jgi:microsomal dipeptidase-like Zn-dependent dipeptidase
MRAKPFSGVRSIAAVIIGVLLLTTVCYGQETLDQANNPTWTGGATNIAPANKVSQIFVPSLPCLGGVEVALKTGNRGRGGDQVTLKILGADGRQLSSTSANIPEGFDGFWRFNLPGGGISVTPGKPITILLQDTGKTVFWWKYKNGNPYPAGPSSFYGSPYGDNDFFFKTYGKKNCQSFSLTVTPVPANLTKGGNQKLTMGVVRQGGFTSAVNISFLNLPSGVSANPATQTIRGNSGTITLMASTSATSGQFTSAVRGTSGSMTVDKNFQIKIPITLSGYVDMHTHPMSYLGFGRKAVHGAPDIGAIIPKGTRDCNPMERRATSINEALGHCNSSHGGWGVDNTCGDYLRAALINFAMDNNFRFKTKNIHGDHEHQGYPAFKFWPHQTSILHQQMWWEWLKRAYEGGLRVMVALTVNNELLAEILNGEKPYDDKTVADVQIDETIRFVNKHRDFMEIAYSSADVRRIVGQNKLAVVLGMEVDKLGNFGKPGTRTDKASVRAEIQRLYRNGVRYAFPIHLIDNSFGGTAVYNMLFSFANKRANGYHFRIAHSADPKVTYNANFLMGFENVSIVTVRGILQGIGQLPAPCFNDLIKCSPPPGKVVCCGSYQNVLNAIAPSPELDIYKIIPPGHVNILGLTSLGEVAINEMMKLGMIIDVDHMSERSMRRTVEIAEKVPGYYPLAMGHNGLRVANNNERSAPHDLVQRVGKLGGMLGLGTADITPKKFISNYRSVWLAMGNRAVGIGTDVDGLEPLPKHEMRADKATSDMFYKNFFNDSRIIKSRQKTGTHTPPGYTTPGWDYVLENGVSHYGLMPEFLYDVKTSQGADVYNNLMQSAEHFAQMWQKCETTAAHVTYGP